MMGLGLVRLVPGVVRNGPTEVIVNYPLWVVCGLIGLAYKDA